MNPKWTSAGLLEVTYETLTLRAELTPVEHAEDVWPVSSTERWVHPLKEQGGIISHDFTVPMWDAKCTLTWGDRQLLLYHCPAFDQAHGRAELQSSITSFAGNGWGIFWSDRERVSDHVGSERERVHAVALGQSSPPASVAEQLYAAYVLLHSPSESAELYMERLIEFTFGP